MFGKKNKVIIDLMYCVGATGMMNIVLQFVVYPLINSNIGKNAFGDMLFWLGIVSILAPSFGLAINNTRLVFPNRQKTHNGDYIRSAVCFSLISIIITVVICIAQKCSVWGFIILGYIVVVSIFRNYSTVEYRLNLNYKKQFYFYAVLSLGYVLGIVVCIYTGSWFGVFVIGETAAVIFVIISGNIYKGIREASEYKHEVQKKCMVLAEAYLLTNLMLNLDRIVLKYGVGNEAVSQYYVLSLLGKTIAIIGGPLSSVIISYISKDNYHLNKKEFGKITAAMLGAGTVFLIAASIITPIYIKLLYPSLYDGIGNLTIIVNAAQIFYFLTTLLLVIVLTMCDPAWQLRIQIFYSVLFIILSIVLTYWRGLTGFAIAAVISNGIYFVMTVLVGFKHAVISKTD